MSKLLGLKQDRVRRISMLNKEAEKMVRDILVCMLMYCFNLCFFDTLL